MNTTENNKLIAEFMGAKEIRKDNFQFPKNGIYSGLPIQLNSLKYHWDWNWLMEVVQKIESIPSTVSSPGTLCFRFDVKIKHHSCRINDWDVEGKNFIHMGGFPSKIEATYAACVAFVKWYNQNQ
jgi:hypothetical protein